MSVIRQRSWRGYGVEEVRVILRQRAAELNSQKALADEIGISSSWLSDILLGHRAPANRVLAYLGLERKAIRIYQPIGSGTESQQRSEP